MPISITCPSCNARFELRDDMAGKKTRCECGTMLDIPATQNSATADPLASAPAKDPLLGGDPLATGSSPKSTASGWSSTPHRKVRRSYSDTEDKGVPGWIAALFAAVLAVVMVVGIMVLMRDDDNAPVEQVEVEPPDAPITTPAPPVDPVPEVPPDKPPPPEPDNSTPINSIGMKLVEVDPDGSWTIGTGNPDHLFNHDEKPAHLVDLSRIFMVGMHEVTQAQFKAVMGSNPSTFPGDNHPVDNIDWQQAVEFCQKLSQRKEEVEAQRAYRLPTEAEWEYMARGGSETTYHFGDDAAQLADHAWFNGNSNETSHPVGQKTPNSLGLHDTLGNVSEWCSDWYSSDSYRTSSRENPTGPREGIVKVLRGGSWANGERSCREGFRFFGAPSDAKPTGGLRVICIPSTGTRLPAQGQPRVATGNPTSTPEDLARRLIDVFVEGQGNRFADLVPNESDLAQLDPAVFGDYEDRAVAIKESLFHYKQIPRNLRFVMGLSRNEVASYFGIDWSKVRIDEIQVRILKGTTGLEHCHAMKVLLSEEESDEHKYALYLNGAANFNGTWKLTNRISHDAIRPLYAEPLPPASLLAYATGYPTAPQEPFTDDGLGVHTYDAAGAIEMLYTPEQVLPKGLAFNRDAVMIAYAYDIKPDPSDPIAGDGRITVWKSATGEVVLDDKWDHDEITATRRDLVDREFNDLRMKVAFTIENDRLAVGRDRVVFWDLKSGNKLPVQDPDGLRWKLDLKGNAISDDPIEPPTTVTLKSPSGRFQLVATRTRDQQGRILSELELKDSEGSLITKVVLPGEIPRLLFTAEDQPLAISKQFIFDIAGQHRLAEKVLWNHEKQFREMMIEDLSTNQQRIVTRYGPSSTRWLVRIWDVPSGREIFVANEELNRFDFSLNKRHALSPDGRWLAVCDRNKIKFWKIFDPMVE